MRGSFVLGICGGVGSGKSTVAREFARLGAAVIDADRLVHEAHADPATRDRIAARFGPGVLDPAGAIDRRALAALVFGETAAHLLARRDLEDIIHPMVRRLITAQVAALQAAIPPPPMIILDVPLVVEGPLRAGCDALVFVEADAAARRARTLRTRGWSEAEHQAREAAQATVEQKRAAARFVVQNDGDQAALAARVSEVWAEVLGGLGTSGSHAKAPEGEPA